MGDVISGWDGCGYRRMKVGVEECMAREIREERITSAKKQNTEMKTEELRPRRDEHVDCGCRSRSERLPALAHAVAGRHGRSLPENQICTIVDGAFAGLTALSSLYGTG